ncbi:ankyrin repeat protein [Aspergillus fumigatus]
MTLMHFLVLVCYFETLFFFLDNKAMEAYSFCALPLELIVMVADYLGPLDLLNLIQGLPHIAPLLNSWHIQAHDENGHTILHHIVEQRLEYLIKPLAKWIPRSSIADNEGWTPLFQAVRNSDESMTKALVYAGADVSAKDHTGKTALHLACYEDAVGIVQILLDHGANPSAADCNGRTPLHDAFGRNTVILQKLIKAGADLNPRRMPRGLAPLYLEAWLGREDAVRILLEAGADPSIQTETGETILQKAIEGSHTKVVQLLLDAGVDINVREFHHGVNAILTAAYWGADDCIRLLQRAGADVFSVDYRGCNALHRAALGGRLSTVKLLLKEGVDSSAEDNRGYTPQRYAVEGVYTHGGSSDIDWEELIRILEDVHTKSPFLRFLNWMRAKCYFTKKS